MQQETAVDTAYFEKHIDLVIEDIAGDKTPDKTIAELNNIRNAISALPPRIKQLLRGAVIAPVFLEAPAPRIITMQYSFYDYRLWLDKRDIVAEWPYMRKSMVMIPDFAGGSNMTETVSSPSTAACVLKELNDIITKINKIIKIFSERRTTTALLKYTIDSLASMSAILEFENLRHARYGKQQLPPRAKEIVDAEILRTQKAAGYLHELPPQMDKDLLLNPFVLNEKIRHLQGLFDNSPVTPAAATSVYSVENFHEYLINILPRQQLYDFRKDITGELKRRRLNPAASLKNDELELDDSWTVVVADADSRILKNAVNSFAAYMKSSFDVTLQVSDNKEHFGSKTILLGTRKNLNGYGENLKTDKDYQLVIERNRIIICGDDAPGAMFGLYNLEAEMNLREAPFLPCPYNETRHSLYKTRMTFSCLGWMQWPDEYLELLPRYGIDAIFVSPYANISGAGRYRGVGRIQSPEKVRDVIRRAQQYGLKIYCQFITQTGDEQLDPGELIQNLIKAFPEVSGYILLTEGFGGGAETVAEIAAAAHELNLELEIIPWNYNGPVLPEATQRKLDFVRECPPDTIPMLTWAKGCKLQLGDEWRYVYDYSISTVGPSEVWTVEQIKIAAQNGIKDIYVRADSWNNWQFGTLPYLPFPQQWLKRFEALRSHGISGTMDSWSYGFNPNFIAELKYWSSWSNAPASDELLKRIAAREFGNSETDSVMQAWEHFSKAVTLIPDTGHGILCNACAAPLFFSQPERRVWQPEDYDATWNSSFYGGKINPYWPYVPQWAFLFPDFTNQRNKAELYAKNYLAYFENMDNGEAGFSLKNFLKHLRLAADEMQRGLLLYRKAAFAAPDHKRQNACRQVLIAEQIHRMLLSDAAVLEFEDLRFKLHNTQCKTPKNNLLARMVIIIKDELIRTIEFDEAAQLDSRIGFEAEADYFYTPYVLKQKIDLLNSILSSQLPDYIKANALQA